jgi:two-component system chemotaxis sensor kinase CheA
MDDLLVDFLTETNEGLAELDVALVKLERNPADEATLSLIFRLVHTIKGTCGFLGLGRLEKVAHAAENVLGKLRDKQLALTGDVITNVLFAIDQIKEIIAALSATGAEPVGEDSKLIATLNAICTGEVAPPPPKPVAAPVAVPVAAAAPAELPVDDAPAPDLPIDAQAGGAASAPAGAQTIRVGVEVLEDLMTLVSELVLTRNQLLQLTRTGEDKGGELGRFTVPLQRLSHITSDLQEGVMKTRMQPIGNAWNKLPRLVRDLARELNKKIELVMLGADTELDRQVLELIKDPLTHMVRNSADHGLETPAARRAAGKQETGQISLNAYHEGGHILIEIADDGAGLAVGRIKAKALANGLATDVELATMSEAQIQRFIMRAGFSTAAAITSVSGRGVGMDVVKTNIEQIGGTIDLKSTEGHGTVFTIKIPLTLAIVSALIVQAGGERFAIPQISVVELVRARIHGAEGDNGGPVVEQINATPVLRLRDQLLPLVSLTNLLRLPEAASTNEAAPIVGAVYIVVTQIGGTTLGIIVDRVFDTEEIVVKPVAPILRHITMFSGNTILGDGSVIMILDPNGIARASGVGGGEGRSADRRATTAQARVASDGKIAMLLFRAGGPEPKAVPLGLIARLEDIDRAKIEFSAGQPVTQYRGRLMPLVPMTGMLDPDRARYSVLVFSDDETGRVAASGPRVTNGGRCMGLVVDDIVDVVEEKLHVELIGIRPGLLGSAVIAGQATDVIDISHYLTQAYADWFAQSEHSAGRTAAGGKARILVVEDSEFFRHLLVPTLASAGYEVAAVSSAAQALRLHDAGEDFDAILSDIEMPDMNGIAFVRAVRAKGRWSDLPVIALTGHVAPEQIELGREAGFTDYVAKGERQALLASLQQCLTTPAALAA